MPKRNRRRRTPVPTNRDSVGGGSPERDAIAAIHKAKTGYVPGSDSLPGAAERTAEPVQPAPAPEARSSDAAPAPEDPEPATQDTLKLEPRPAYPDRDASPVTVNVHGSERPAELDSKALQQLLADAIGPLQARIAEMAESLAAVNAEKERADAAREKAEQDAIAAEQAKAEAAAAAEQAQQQVDALVANLNASGGNPTPVKPQKDKDGFPMINVLKSKGNDASRDFLRLWDSAPKVAVQTPGGALVLQRDNRELDAYAKDNWKAIRAGVESEMKSAGYLTGGYASPVTRDAVTVKSDIPDFLLAYTSTALRMAHSARYIFRQFATELTELGRRPGYDTIKIPRWVMLADPAPGDIADYQMSPGTPLSTSNAAITEKAVSCAIEELGRGGADAPALGFATFVNAYSLLDIENQIQNVLGKNYQAYTDLRLRTLWSQTDVVLYNRQDEIATAPTDLTAADDGGGLTRSFLISLAGYMDTQKIPPLDDGRWILVLPPAPLTQLLKEMNEANDRFYLDGTDVTTVAFNAMTGLDLSTLNGYHGVFASFHVFSTNAYGVGAAATEGVQEETLGGALGAKVTRTCYAAGRSTIAHGISLPVELRPRDTTDFGRMRELIWYSHEGYARLDVKNTTETGEQLRVVKINVLDNPV